MTGAPRLPRRRSDLLVPLGLAALLTIVYFGTMYPGVGEGDMAEFQYMSPTLGICHSPGYQIQTLFGKMFSLLPLGGTIAWRINLMSVVAAVLGCLALHGAVRRITGRSVAGVVAATTLAFSVIYWSFAVVAESYVFSGFFLAAAVYASVRFVQEDSDFWLYASALCMGMSVGDRPSELFVLPALLGLVFFLRGRIRWNPKRVLVAAALLVLPLALAAASIVVRSDPSRLGNRDDYLRDRIIGPESPEIRFGVDPEAPLGARLREAASYALGLSWSRDSATSLSMRNTMQTMKKYGWLLSGLGVFGGEYYPGKLNPEELRGGTNIGIAGVILALIGTFVWRREPGWLVLGWGLFLGNLAFIVFHARWDNLTFTVPGAIGLSLLAGLGAAWPTSDESPRRKASLYRAACLLLPALLLFTNGPYGSRNTPGDRNSARRRMAVARAPWPAGSVIIATYWPIMAFRYLLHIEAGRQDIHIIQCSRENWPALIKHFEAQGQPVFIPRAYLRNALPRSSIRRAPAPLAELGFVRAVAEGLDDP